MKGKIFSLLIMFCFTAPLATTFVAYHVQKRHVRRSVRRNMMAGIDKNDLVLLRFSEQEKNQLNWEHAKEFEFEGQMYDVVSKEINGDTTSYWCWKDNAETALNQKLDKLVQYAFGKSPQNRENQKRLQSFIKSLYFSPSADESFHFALSAPSQNPFRATMYHSIANSPPVPPPEFLN